jgi:RIO kinase 2
MVSTQHKNKEFYFDRDVECIHTFFERRYDYTADYTLELSGIEKIKSLDNDVKASGFIKK